MFTERHDWSLDESVAIHDMPLFELLDRARAVHVEIHPKGEVQLCSLLSVKTGACPEDCSYCPQSAHYDAGVQAEKLMDVDDVLAKAELAREAGASRFCMGAAWREVRDGSDFDDVLRMVAGVRDLGMEACVTLGMLSGEQACRLKDAGLTAYNHNLDTSREFYSDIITTRTYQERLDTLAHVRDAGITVCSGGIIGMGESIDDRCGMLVELANLPKHPESVPVNALVAATHVLVPIQASYFALEGTDDLLETIDKIKARANPDLNLLGVLITLYDRRTVIAPPMP